MTREAPDFETSAACKRAPGRPKSRPDAVERERITAQAQALFLASGYGATTMDAVAGRCGISKRTLYRLFPGKADLFQAMVAQHRRQALDLPRDSRGEPLESALAAIFRLDDATEAEDDRIAFVLLAIAEAEHFPEIGFALRLEGVDPSRRLLAEWLGTQQEAGRLRRFPPEAAARMLLDMIFSGQARRFLGDHEWSREQRVAHAKLCIDLFLAGLAPQSIGQSAAPATS